jgi:hypothetical protein
MVLGAGCWALRAGNGRARLPNQRQAWYAFHRLIGGQQFRAGGKGGRRNHAIGGILAVEIRALRKGCDFPGGVVTG